MKILLVDDEVSFLEQAKEFLENRKRKFEIITANSAIESLDILEKDDFDAIASDYKMPEMDGLELLRVLREEKDNQIPFILITGKGREKVVVEALNLGADHYIEKSGNTKRQLKKLAHVVENEVKHHRMRGKSQLLHSLLNHELLNKLNSIGLYHEILKFKDLTKEQAEYVEKADEAAQQAIEVIEKVRKLESIDEEDIEPINLNDILEKVIENKSNLLELENIDVEYEPKKAKVMGGELVEDIFQNLVDNAIRHSGCNKIKIITREKEDKIMCRVEDNGKGIHKDLRKKIFERGFKLGDSSGSGLGLYLVRIITENYGGRIKVGDSELGGARFDVYLEKADTNKESTTPT